MLLDGLRRQIDTSVAPGTTIQWNFTDAEPWHYRGSTTARRLPRRGGLRLRT